MVRGADALRDLRVVGHTVPRDARRPRDECERAGVRHRLALERAAEERRKHTRSALAAQAVDERDRDRNEEDRARSKTDGTHA